MTTRECIVCGETFAVPFRRGNRPVTCSPVCLYAFNTSRVKRWREANPEKVREMDKRWHAANPERSKGIKLKAHNKRIALARGFASVVGATPPSFAITRNSKLVTAYRRQFELLTQEN